MSKTSIKERNKAIRLAWEREQQLVREGKGTRDWTNEQQQDIMDSDKGKAYDEKGRAFQGQHMKSAAEYPEYQGDPDNIQFLTRDEHLDAHKGSWQNPTNWYYDPVTKEYMDFGDYAPTPCKIIELSDPVIDLKFIKPKETAEKEYSAKDQKTENDACTKQKSTDSSAPRSTTPPLKEVIASTSRIETTPSKTRGFIRGLKSIGEFIIEHPVESLEIAGVVVSGAIKVVSSIKGNSNANNTASNSTSRENSDINASESENSDIGAAIADIIEKATRATPHENDVPGHRQRYHTKDGVVWRDKAPYHRGGKSEE